MDREMWTVLSIIVGAVVGLFLLVNGLLSYSCSNYQEMTGIETKYVFMDSCYVKQGNSFEHWEVYKLRAATNQK